MDQHLGQRTASRRNVLRVSGKLAYTTPLVLMTMRAIPAYADVNADLSEDAAEVILKSDLSVALTVNTSTNAVDPQQVAAALAQLTIYQADFDTLVGQVSSSVPQGNSQPLSPALNFGRILFRNAVVPTSGGGFVSLIPASTISTVGAAKQYGDLILNTLRTALTQLQASPSSSSLLSDSQLASRSAFDGSSDTTNSTIPINVEEQLEAALLALVGLTP